MVDNDNDDDEPVGRGKPPKSGRFTHGHNRSQGKRKRRKPKPLPHEAVLGLIVSVPDQNGIVVEMTLERAVLLHLRNLGLMGHMPAQEQLSKTAAEIRKRIPGAAGDDTEYLWINNFVGSVNDVVLALDMAEKKDPDGPDPIILLRPWLVEEALARIDAPLSVEAQRIVWEATLTPKNVGWPDWWSERRGTGKPRQKRNLVEGGFYPPCITDDEDDEPE